LFTCAALVVLGTFAQVNPVWLIGPYQPGSISAGSVPGWYMGFLEPGDLGAGVLDNAEELVSRLPALASGRHGPVGVQVAAADRGAHHADDRVGRGVDRRVGYVCDADVTGSVHQRRLHAIKPSTAGTGVSTVKGTLTGSPGPLLSCDARS
jgi:hypothetical protein